MTISISSLHQNTQSDPKTHKSIPTSKAPIKSSKKTHSQPRAHEISRLITSRRRRGVKNPEAEDGEDELTTGTNGHLESESSSSNDDSSISSLVNSDPDDDDDDDNSDNDDDENKNKRATQDQVNEEKMKHNDPTGSDDDDDTQFQVDLDDLEAGFPKPAMLDSQPNENFQNHSHLQSITKDSLFHDQAATKAAQNTSSTAFPNKIAKIQLGQTPSDEHSFSSHIGQPNALSPPTSSANPINARPSKQQQTSVAVSSQPLNTAIIFNQASWVTGLSAALAATTTPSNSNALSTDDQPAQTPRYIPYIEFENYSAYGNLIFDLNSGLGRTARVDRKPDGLDKAPSAALEEQFVRIQPSLEHPLGSGQLSTSLSRKGSRRKSTLPVVDQPDLHQAPDDEPEGTQTSRRANKLVSLSEKNKKKNKKKKKEALTLTSSETNGEEASNVPSDQRIKIKIISPSSSSSKNRLPIEASSPSASPHHNPTNHRPPSSLASGLNRPSSAYSYAAHSEGNRSVSASEAHSLEPWAVPRSGRFWGHDDRQSYSQRRGGRGGFVQNRGGSGSARGTLRKRAGFRVDWPSTPPSFRRSLAGHGPTHRPETPAGQSDAGRSVGSGAGWITVSSKQKGIGTDFHQNRHSQLHSHKHKSDQVDGGEWRHDGWEEIEREADRKHHSNDRGGSGVNLQSRGTGWRGGVPSVPTRRSATNFVATPSNRSSHAPSPLDTPAVGNKIENRVSSFPHHASIQSVKEVDAVQVRSKSTTTSTEDLQIKSSRDSLPKLLNGDDPYEEEKKTESVTTPDHVTQPHQSSVQSEVVVPSDDTDAVPLTLPKTIKIGTIPVYPPVTLQSVVTEKNQSPELKVPSSPNDQVGSNVCPIDQSPSTPELSDTPQVSRSASTLDDLSSLHPGPGFTPAISAEGGSGSITLGSAGGAHVLREAMSTPKSLQPSHPSQHDLMIPQSRFEHPMGMVNSFGHSRTSSFNSHTFPPASFGPHPEFSDQPPHLPPPPPLCLPHNHHQPHLASSATYHHPIQAPPPQTFHSPANLYQPQLPALPPLQYFEPNHNLSYPHPSPLGPPPMNHVYVGYMPQQPPPPPQVAPSRSHHSLYHPQPSTFEPPPPPLPPPPPPLSAPVTATTSSGVILPGHFAPPKSSKVRISNPGSSSGGNLLTTDHHQNFHYHLADHSSRIPSDAILNPTDPSQIKTTETGINYYEHNGVTYFGDCIPTITPATNAPTTSATSDTLINDSFGNEGEKSSGAGAANPNRNGMMNDVGINHGFMVMTGDEIRPEDPHRFFSHPHYHHQYQSHGPLGHGFDLSGHRIESSVPNHSASTDRAPFNPNNQHHHSACHTNNGHSITGSSGQVVLSQVIRPPPIPFG